MESGFFWFVGVLYMGSGAVAIFWVSYRAAIAAQILAVFWVVMLPVVIWLYKRTQFEPYYVDQFVVDKTKQDLSTHRSNVRSEFLKTEIALLEKGEKSPVLDVWRLDAGVQKRHPFFSCIDAVSIGPVRRELQIRLQIGDPPQPAGQRDRTNSPFLRNVLEFLVITSGDSHVRPFKKFFDSVILEIYALRENEEHVDVAFPVFSMETKAQNLWKLASVDAKVRDLSVIGDMRFEDGNEIEPHRSIESPKPGSK